MAEAVLNRVGRLQGAHDDPWRDEQPGRTVRAVQRGPLARLSITPFARYYGDYAGPFAYIFALGQLYAWSGEKSLLQKHWDIARRIAEWAREHGDIDGDGYLEYKTRSEGGPTHQGWRDAENAVVYEDGSQVKTPIATCEIQGYWFAAEQLMAVFAAILGEPKVALKHWHTARDLKERFNRDFWINSENSVALGLDPDKRQIRSVTSNAGQALATGIVSDEHLPRLVRRLLAPDMFSGWGIRTLSSTNPAYNPLSYHLGSFWPVENATMLFGLRRFGFDREALAHFTPLRSYGKTSAFLSALVVTRGMRQLTPAHTREPTPHKHGTRAYSNSGSDIARNCAGCIARAANRGSGTSTVGAGVDCPESARGRG